MRRSTTLNTEYCNAIMTKNETALLVVKTNTKQRLGPFLLDIDGKHNRAVLYLQH